MSSKIREAFIIETFLLSRVNHEQWDKFIMALNDYTIETVKNSIKALPEHIAMAAGQAQQMVKIYDDFKDIEMVYKNIKRQN